MVRHEVLRRVHAVDGGAHDRDPVLGAAAVDILHPEAAEIRDQLACEHGSQQLPILCVDCRGVAMRHVRRLHPVENDPRRILRHGPSKRWSRSDAHRRTAGCLRQQNVIRIRPILIRLHVSETLRDPDHPRASLLPVPERARRRL